MNKNTKTPVTEYDVVFISYDEPNANENWYHLQSVCPWAKRSHGIYGSDAAHKAAANLSETARFITIDADNQVLPGFFDIDIDESRLNELDVVSWAGRNTINGLCYGNGGIKLWPVNVVQSMRSHEHADARDKRSQVDFCWNVNYVQMNNVYSDVINNASPYQAFRAGFREGSKMSLLDGDIITPFDHTLIHPVNYRRLLIWMSVGSDVSNGLWAVYGARLGFYMTNFERESWTWQNIRDFHWHNAFWDQEIKHQFVDEAHGTVCASTGYSWSFEKLHKETSRLGDKIRTLIPEMNLVDLNTTQSKFFKSVWTPPSRLKDALVREEDVIKGIE